MEGGGAVGWILSRAGPGLHRLSFTLPQAPRGVLSKSRRIVSAFGV